MSELNKLNAEDAENANPIESSPQSSETVTPENTPSEETSVTESTATETPELVAVDTPEVSNEDDEVLNEIEESNAEDAEDEGNKDRHSIEVKEYDSMSLEGLAIELEKLVQSQKVQAIKSHVDGINAEFKTQYQALVDEKRKNFK
ncbi:hypothetical protein [Algibacter miyuki]|uniref:hypothetical protein n=1 Tax=Algibacter miyuki TaxID=1306933 RepID=UPI0030150AB9